MLEVLLLQAQIIITIEIWIQASDHMSFHNNNNFMQFAVCQTDRKGGGVMILAHTSVIAN